MNEKLLQALEQISDKKIAEAASAKGRGRRFFLRALAAVLAVVILVNVPNLPMVISAKAVSTTSGSRAVERPAKYGTEQWDVWLADRDQRQAELDAALPQLTSFFGETITAYMTGATENRVWSPVNAYIVLAMLAEVTEGNSRTQILELLNTADLDTLRTQVEAVWETLYKDDGNEICTLANSLWLDKDVEYVQEAMDNVAYYHYADIYQTDLSSSKAGKALRAWLSNNTGGLLKDKTGSASFPPEAVLTLASTVYLQSKWANEFSSGNNTTGIFHAPGGDVEVTYMNKKESQMNYYWGGSFGAVALGLKNGTRMWFFLPDEDKTVDDILSGGEYLELLGASETENCKYMKVNLSVPKFDISSSADLSGMLQSMGVTDVFDLGAADFTAITADSPVYVTAVNQAARVVIDEQGVKAASYIEIPGAGAAAPPEEIIDFILDRPFLFIIADYNGIPVFTGVVNEP